MTHLPNRGAGAFVVCFILAAAIFVDVSLRAQAPEARGSASANTSKRAAGEPPRENILEGTEGRDILEAGEQDAWLFGREGDDVLHGGVGSDALDGGPGEDRLLGGGGDDVLDGGPGADQLRGNDGDDMMDGGDEEDALNGGPGADDMEGGDADDILRGEGGDDVIAGGDGDDVLVGGDGADELFGRDGNDKLSGGPGDDLIEGADGTDQLEGGAGDDLLDGGESQDVIRGEAGSDVLDGGSGGDLLNAGPGNDSVLGSGGDDFIDGGDGHDTMLGGPGDDAIIGGQGYDWFLGGLGADVVRAGSEDDLIVVRAGDVPADGGELIDGGTGDDILILNGFMRPVLTPTSSLPEGRLFLTDPYSGGAYFVSSVEKVRYSQVFTQLSGPASSDATFVFVNPSATITSSADLTYFNHEGAPQPLSVGPAAPEQHYSLRVPPLGLVDLVASGVDPSLQGSALVLTEHPLAGAAADGSARDALLGDNFIVPVLESATSGIHTGIVLFSSTVPSSVKLTLRREDGQEVSTQSQGGVEIEIPAHGRQTHSIGETFLQLLEGRDFQGALTVEGGIDRPQDGGSLAVMGVMQVAGGRTTTFPAIQLAPTPRTQTLHFAALTAGDGAASSIVLVNTSSENAQGVITFFNDDGSPWAVQLEGAEAATTATFNIAPFGSAVFKTTELGSHWTGIARAESVSGTIGAVVRGGADAPPTGPSQVFGSFIAPVQSDASTGANTRVALVSTQSALNLTLVLRDVRGVEVQGGRAQVQAPANGGVRRALDELFPNADTSSFRGTLAVNAEGGAVAVEVLHVTESGAQVLAPTVELQP